MTLESVKEQALVRQEFGATQQMERIGDMGVTAAAAQAKAVVEARYVMALQRPRDWDTVRQKLIKECSRPSFANDKSALYKKPVGGGNTVDGLGIRFAEVAVRCMTNVLVESPTVYEDDMRRQVRVIVTDLESNATYMKDVVVTKTVERTSIRPNDPYLSVRMNSENKPTYTIAASEDALLNKEGALISKAIRTSVLRLVPGDLQDECEKTIIEIREKKIKEDPDAAKRNIIDSFGKVNVTVAQLTAYLGHPIEQCTPAELGDLRSLYGALHDGEATWASVMENVDEERKGQTTKAKAAVAASAGGGGEDTTAKARGVEATKAKVAAAKKAEPAPAVAASVQPAAAPEQEVEEPPPAAPKPAPKPAAAAPPPAAAPAVAAQRLPVRGVQFPDVVTRQPDDPQVDPALFEKCREQAKRLKQPPEKLVASWLKADFNELNEVSVVLLTQVLEKIPTPGGGNNGA